MLVEYHFTATKKFAANYKKFQLQDQPPKNVFYLVTYAQEIIS